MAEHIGWKPSLTAALGKIGETLAVRQVALISNLIYTIPEGTPSGIVHRVVFTQDGTGGHMVTYDDQPVSVDLTAGASTTVELHPVGTGYVVRYPVVDLDAQVSALAEDGGSALSASLSSTYGMTVTDSPAKPPNGQARTYWVTSAVSWPADIEWSTDPDGNAVPTITSAALVSLATIGSVTYGVLGASFTTVAAPDVTNPTAGTLSVASQTHTTINASVSGASDETALHATPYAFSSNGGSTYSAWQASASYQYTGLTASTSYNLQHKVRDASGNEVQGVVVAHSTSATPADTTPPTVGTLAGSSITETGFTLTVSVASDETALHATPYDFSLDNGATWKGYQASAVYVATGLTAGTGHTCQHRVRDAAGNVSTGTAITVTTATVSVLSALALSESVDTITASWAGNATSITWGDGSTTSNPTTGAQHTYSAPGAYMVIITDGKTKLAKSAIVLGPGAKLYADTFTGDGVVHGRALETGGLTWVSDGLAISDGVLTASSYYAAGLTTVEAQTNIAFAFDVMATGTADVLVCRSRTGVKQSSDNSQFGIVVAADRIKKITTSETTYMLTSSISGVWTPVTVRMSGTLATVKVGTESSFVDLAGPNAAKFMATFSLSGTGVNADNFRMVTW